MRRALFALVAVSIWMTGCSSDEDPSKLVQEANAMLVNGGIENSEIRAIAEQKYDRAIRIICGEDDFYCTPSGSGSAPGTADYNIAHAQFGLAFARSFDLVDRIRQLSESGAIGGSQGDLAESDDETDENESAAELAALCEERSNLPQLIPLLRTIIDTSLLPIVDSLKVVTSYPQFSIEYEKGFLDLSFLDPTTEEPIGVDFGTYDGAKAKFSVNEAYGALALYRTLVAGAEGVFSFNDLTQNLIVFLPKFDAFGSSTRPYLMARLLNSDPCTTNPLFDPSFGVLTEAGRETFENIRTQLDLMFDEQGKGFAQIAEREDAQSLLNYSGSGAWATNILGRIRTGNSTGDAEIEAVGSLLTGVVTPEEMSNLFKSLRASLNESGSVFDAGAFVDANENLKTLLEASESHPRDLGVPAISFKTFFESPISDLKAIAPLYYAASEEYGYDRNMCPEVRREVLSFELQRGDEDKNAFYCDANGDMHWNARGDFIVQPEREAFLDSANNGNAAKAEKPVLNAGILGTFWDFDGNGIPDAGFEGLIPGMTANIAVTASTTKLYMNAVTNTPSEAETLRTFFRESPNGCLDNLPVAGLTATPETATCVTEVGDVLGHVWPEVFPGAYTAPTLSDSRRRDPSNGVVDEMYMFFPNPSLNGVFRIEDGKGGYRAFANEDMNRFLSGLLTFDAALGRIRKNK